MRNELYFSTPIENHWEIVQIDDENGQSTNYVAVRSELKSFSSELCLQKLLKSGKKIIGLSSYQEFPGKISNPHEPLYSSQFIKKYASNVVLWCHCFRRPEMYIPSSIPLLLYSESDQYTHTATLNAKANTISKKFDFFVSMPEGDWNNYIRGLSIAQKWINYMAERLNLKILVCGTNRQKDFCSKVSVIDFQKWCDFTDAMNSCKYLFCSSIHDASPRIIVEALCLDMPVLLHQDILGGWKYINESTGMLFHPDSDISTTVQSFIQSHYSPMIYSKATFQIKKNAKILADAVKQWEPKLVDGILYINLVDRKDRKKEILQELEAMNFPQSMIFRIDAIQDDRCGHLGCAKSHIKALQFAKAKGWQRVLILEDDFSFSVSEKQMNDILSEFYQVVRSWGVFMLASYHITTQHFHKNIQKVNYGSTAAGYIVSHRFLDTLLSNFQEAVVLLERDVYQYCRRHPGRKKMTTPYAIDVHWNQLQKQGYFYISNPRIGKQSGSPSTIMSE